MINVGDIVKVKDWGESYSCNMEWFLNNHIDTQLMIRYAYGDGHMYDIYNSDTGKKDTFRYEVLAVADNKALIAEPSNYNNTQAFLVRTEALINTKEIHHMTIEEIEDELGYPIEIIE